MVSSRNVVSAWVLLAASAGCSGDVAGLGHGAGRRGDGGSELPPPPDPEAVLWALGPGDAVDVRIVEVESGPSGLEGARIPLRFHALTGVDGATELAATFWGEPRLAAAPFELAFVQPSDRPVLANRVTAHHPSPIIEFGAPIEWGLASFGLVAEGWSDGRQLQVTGEVHLSALVTFAEARRRGLEARAELVLDDAPPRLFLDPRVRARGFLLPREALTIQSDEPLVEPLELVVEAGGRPLPIQAYPWTSSDELGLDPPLEVAWSVGSGAEGGRWPVDAPLTVRSRIAPEDGSGNAGEPLEIELAPMPSPRPASSGAPSLESIVTWGRRVDRPSPEDGVVFEVGPGEVAGFVVSTSSAAEVALDVLAEGEGTGASCDFALTLVPGDRPTRWRAPTDCLDLTVDRVRGPSRQRIVFEVGSTVPGTVNEPPARVVVRASASR